MAGFIRDYKNHVISETELRAFTYAMGKQLDLLKAVRDQAIEARLDEIETQLAELKKEKAREQ